MRKPRTGEVVGTAIGLGVGAVLGAAVMRGVTNDSGPEQSHVMFPQVTATIAHTENAEGLRIGVRTYASPFSNEQRRSREEGERVYAVCVEPDGRDLIDTNVPPDQSQERGNDWYLIAATPDSGKQEWVNTSYTEVTDAAGSAAVVACATVEGLDYVGRGN